jgi:hypothetical protein
VNWSVRSVYAAIVSGVRRWPFVALFLGLVLQVAAWVLVIPPYSTYDEFDHVYRASGVWHGQFTAVKDPPPGYSGAVIADRDLVEDGVSECMRLPYTGLGRCLPGSSERGGTVLVTSGAAYYNPLYYLLVSPASAIGSGAGTVMGMRVWSVSITLAVIAWAVFLLSTWQRPRKTILGVALTASPMLTISMAVVAPNGLEMAAGILWWIALITITQRRIPPRGTWAALVLAGSLLTLLRSLGPFFLVVALAVMALWRGRELRELWRTNRRAMTVSVSVIGICLGLSVFWILTQHVHAVEVKPVLPDVGPAEGLIRAAGYFPVMIMLFVGAIPARNIAPPMIAVSAWLIPFALLLVNTRWRQRPAARSLAALIAVVLIFPVIFQGLLFGRLGIIWQSRYILPLAVGIPILAALQSKSHRVRDRINDVVAVSGLLVAHTAFLLSGLAWYRVHSPLIDAGRFPPGPQGLPIALSVLGVGATGVALWLATRNAGRVETPLEARLTPIETVTAEPMRSQK